MRRLTTFVALAVALAASTSEAAKPTSKPSTGGKPAITKTQTQKVGVTKTSTGKPSAPKGSTVKSTSPSASKSVKPTKPTTQLASGGGQTKASGKPAKSAKPDTGIAKADKSVKTQGAQAKNDAKSTKPGSSTTTTTTTASSGRPLSGASTPVVDFTATKVGQKLERNSNLRSKIEAKLQAAGYTGTAYEAAYGFKNLGQLNAATNTVQNHGTSFDLLKVLMTGTYVDPVTHNVYRTQKLPDGTTQLVKPELATTSASTVSLGQAKQAITGGAEMPKIVAYTTTSPTASKTTTSSTATAGTVTTTTGKSKPRKSYATTPTTQPGGGNF